MDRDAQISALRKSVNDATGDLREGAKMARDWELAHDPECQKCRRADFFDMREWPRMVCEIIVDCDRLDDLILNHEVPSDHQYSWGFTGESLAKMVREEDVREFKMINRRMMDLERRMTVAAQRMVETTDALQKANLQIEIAEAQLLFCVLKRRGVRMTTAFEAANK